MKNIRFYIKSTNFYECDKAKKILKQLCYIEGNFISARSEGWVYGDSDGVIKFLMSTITSYPAAHAPNFIEYRVYNIDNFPEEIIKAYKLNNIKKLITQPIVTKKEYRNTIEILKEVKSNIKGGENWYITMCYEEVIRDLEKRYGM